MAHYECYVASAASAGTWSSNITAPHEALVWIQESYMQTEACALEALTEDL
jgi:hypothetical protein